MPTDIFPVPAQARRPGSPSRKRGAPAPLACPKGQACPTLRAPEREPGQGDQGDASAPKRGAPLGNTNALKHGFYARAFHEAEQSDISSIDPASLEHEIELLRVFIRRTAIQAEKVNNLNDSLMCLNVMSRAALSLASLMRTQRAAVAAHDHDEFQRIVLACQAEFRKANALTNRLQDQLAALETAYDAAYTAAVASIQAAPQDQPAGEPPEASAASDPTLRVPLALGVPEEAGGISSAPAVDAPPSPAPAIPAENDPDDDASQPDDPLDSLLSLVQNALASHAPTPDDPGDAETGDDETGDEYCKIPFDCIACPERPTCDSCPAQLKPHAILASLKPPHLTPPKEII